MKKLIAIALILCFLPVCAFAADVYLFNVYAAVLCEERIDTSTAVQRDEYTVYTANGCKFGFYKNEDRITIQGNGISFFAYAIAATMVYDDSAESYNENAGKLMIAFLRARDGEQKYGYISTGEFFYINILNDDFVFTIGK